MAVRNDGCTAGLKSLAPALERRSRSRSRSRTPTCSSWQAAVSASTSSSMLQAQGRAMEGMEVCLGEARLCRWPEPKGCA